MACNLKEEEGTSCSVDATKPSKFDLADCGSEWRSWDQFEASPPSTSPAWNSEEDEDSGSCMPGTRPSDLYGKFTWKIENFSQISKRELRSNMFEVGGYKWYILVYPQGCDVCNHLSLFLCVADYDKLLPGWSHFVQFTIAVVNKDPKKSKYSDTLHRFCKKEHDWGWKKFMELSKVLDGFTVADTLVIKAQVQVIRENPHRPFRCLDCQYRRELVRVYMTNVEGICRRFVEEKRDKIGKLMGDPLRWPSFRAFWAALEENVRRRLSREKTETILKAIVKAFFNEKEVTSTLVMDALYSGCKALDYRSKNKKGKINGVEIEEARNPIVWVDKDFFVLAGDVLLLLDRAAHDSLPSYKDEKGPQNRTKDGGPGDDFGKDTMERDERRLTELGRRTVEMFVLAHLFSNRVEVEYLEAIALKRQEELIREEEAAGQAEIELKARREAAEKEKRNKKKQAKQRRNNRKEKERDGEEKQPVAGQSRLGEGSTSSRAALGLSKEVSARTVDIADEDDDSSVLDNTDGIVGTLRAALEDGDADRTFWEREGSDFHQMAEASFSGGSCIASTQNGRSNRKQQSLLDDSSSTCSSDSIPSNNATLGGFSRRRSNTADQLPNSVNRVRGRIGSDRELRVGDTKGMLRGRAGIGSSSSTETNSLGGVDAETVVASLKQRVQWLQQRVQWLQQRLSEKEEEVVLLHQQLSLYEHHYGCDILKEDDPKIGKVSDCCQSQVGSDSAPLSPSREGGESLKNGASLDDFQDVRTEPAASVSSNSLANGSCSETPLGSTQSLPVAGLSKVSATSPSLGAMGSPRLMSLPSAMYDNITVHGLPESFASTSQSILASSLTVESGIVRPSSAPSPPEVPWQSPSFQQHFHPPQQLARSVSATGRLGVTSSESASSCTQPGYPVVPSYRNAAAGVIRSSQAGGSGTHSDASLRSQTSYPHASGSETYRLSPTLSGIGDQSPLGGSIYQRNLPGSVQTVASKAKGEALIQGYANGGVENRSGQDLEHRRGGVGWTFGTVTPEVLHLQHQLHCHTESSEGSTLETNIMSREPERYREHQYNGTCSDKEFVQQLHGAQNSVSLMQNQVTNRVAGQLAGGPLARQGGAEMPGLASVMSEDFPHLDIINELLDEDRLLGAKALNAFFQQPVGLHELQRMYDGRVCVDINSLHGSAERSDNAIPPHDNGGVPQFANSTESVLGGIGEGIQLHPYAHSSLQSSIGLPGGIVDAMSGHHWQGRSGDALTATANNGMQVGLDMLMGYPIPSPHLPMADCPPFSLGQNGYPMYSPIKHP